MSCINRCHLGKIEMLNHEKAGMGGDKINQEQLDIKWKLLDWVGME